MAEQMASLVWEAAEAGKRTARANAEAEKLRRTEAEKARAAAEKLRRAEAEKVRAAAAEKLRREMLEREARAEKMRKAAAEAKAAKQAKEREDKMRKALEEEREREKAQLWDVWRPAKGTYGAEDYVAGGRTPGHSWEQDGEQFIIRVPIEKPINFKRDVKFEMREKLGTRRAGSEMRLGVDRITSISLVVHETTYLCGNLAGQVHIADNEFACAVQRGASGKTTGIVITLDLPHRLDSMVVRRICRPQNPQRSPFLCLQPHSLMVVSG